MPRHLGKRPVDPVLTHAPLGGTINCYSAITSQYHVVLGMKDDFRIPLGFGMTTAWFVPPIGLRKNITPAKIFIESDIFAYPSRHSEWCFSPDNLFGYSFKDSTSEAINHQVRHCQKDDHRKRYFVAIPPSGPRKPLSTDFDLFHTTVDIRHPHRNHEKVYHMLLKDISSIQELAREFTTCDSTTEKLLIDLASAAKTAPQIGTITFGFAGWADSQSSFRGGPIGLAEDIREFLTTPYYRYYLH